MLEFINYIGTSGWFSLIVGLSSIFSLIIGGRALYKCNIIIKNSMNNNTMATGKGSMAAGRDVNVR